MDRAHLAHVTAIVTGGAGGIGRALVHGLLAAGARVLAVDLDGAALERLEQGESKTNRLAVACLDLADAAASASAVQSAAHAFGSFNTVVCNAGIGRVQYTRNVLDLPPRVWEVPAGMWEHFFRVNTLGGIRLLNAAVPAMRPNGWGRVLVVTTSLDSMLNAGTGPYGPSKAALEAYAAVLAAELADTAITVNVVVPGGPTDTAMIPNAPGLARSDLLAPEVMVDPVNWLCSAAADGQTARRFRADVWQPGEQGDPIAWAGIAAGQKRLPPRSSPSRT